MVGVNSYTANVDAPTFKLEKGKAIGTGKGYKKGESLKGSPVRLEISGKPVDLIKLTNGSYVKTSEVTMTISPKKDGILLRALPIAGAYGGIHLAMKKGWTKPYQIFLVMLAGSAVASLPKMLINKKG